MQKFEEIAVVRGINDGKEAGFLLGFLKFAGVSAVEYVYNDLFDGFNKYVEGYFLNRHACTAEWKI